MRLANIVARASLASLVLLASPAVLRAQNFTGTYSIPGGNVPITLTLRQNGQMIAGSLSGQSQFQIQAQVQGQMFQGYATNAQGRIYIAGQFDPSSGGLQVAMAEVDQQGMPQQQTLRQMMATRTGPGGGAQRGMAQGPGQGQGMGQPQGMGQGMGQQQGMGGGSANGQLGATAQDRQIVQLILRSAWCSFSYSQTSGTSHTERVVYRADGTGTQSTGGETYNSGPNGTVSGQSSGGTAFRWRVQNGVLLATADGVQWGQYPLQITQNSSGYPIITAAGKEYSMCN